MPPKKKIKKGREKSKKPIEVIVPVSDEILEQYFSIGEINLPGEHLSPSSMMTYQRCAMQYYKQYVLGDRSGDSVESMEGTTHHSAFEFNNLYKIKTGRDRPVKQAIEFFCDTLHDNWKTIDNKKNVTERDLIIRGKKIQTIYHNTFAPRLTPLFVEQEFNIYVGPVKILCYADVIGILSSKRGPDRNVVCDYKVAGKLKSDKDVTNSIQLNTYGVGEMALRFTDVPETLDVGFCTCTKDNRPLVEWQYATFHQGRIDWFIRTVLSVADGISRGAFPVCNPVENNLCSKKWCNNWDGCLGSCVKKRKGRK